MFSYNHYIPILKGKNGEFGALAKLAKEVKKQVTPLIDVVRLSHAKKNETLEGHLKNTAEKISTSWGTEHTIYIDLFDIDLTNRTSEGIHPMAQIFDYLSQEGVKSIPSTGLDRDDDYNLEVKKISQVEGRGVCIRILKEDMDFIEDLIAGLDSLMGFLKVDIKDVHLLLDFRAIESVDMDSNLKRALTTINSIPKIADYCTVTMAGSGYPQSLKQIGRNTVAKLPRVELTLWKLILSERNKLARIPSFGDYTIVHPDLLDFDFTKMTSGGKIRYTLEKEWLIFKGSSLKKPPKYKQFHDLSEGVAGHPEFYGQSYSWGDTYISKCAKMITGSGNLETWVKVGVNHHLTFVGEQISNVA